MLFYGTHQLPSAVRSLSQASPNGEWVVNSCPGAAVVRGALASHRSIALTLLQYLAAAIHNLADGSRGEESSLVLKVLSTRRCQGKSCAMK